MTSTYKLFKNAKVCLRARISFNIGQLPNLQKLITQNYYATSRRKNPHSPKLLNQHPIHTIHRTILEFTNMKKTTSSLGVDCKSRDRAEGSVLMRNPFCFEVLIPFIDWLVADEKPYMGLARWCKCLGKRDDGYISTKPGSMMMLSLNLTYAKTNSEINGFGTAACNTKTLPHKTQPISTPRT